VAEKNDGRLLVVDDNEMNRDMLSRRLQRKGYSVATADGGVAALEAVEGEPFDLILLDIMMPDINGMEVLKRLRETHSQTDLPIIMATAKDESSDIVAALKLGANDYVTKPLDFPVVQARVANALGRKRAAEALKAANKRMQRDLEAAARVQQALLPDEAPDVTGVEFAWYYRPCDELGGDAFNLFKLDDQQVALYVLDVSGHGVPSALLSVAVGHQLSQLFAQRGEHGEIDNELSNPAQLAKKLNTLFPMDMKARLYFTLVYGVLDTRTGAFCFVTAGSPGPSVIHADGSTEVHDVPGVPIGMLPESEHENTVIQLQAGDRLYLHSDGLYEERHGESGELFERERMTGVLADNRSVSLEQSMTSLVEAVSEWRGDTHLSDDATVVACMIQS
jgi:sigma-B regulation protein RsbU (phosphoserine phosphatase)